jgi:hypothetical protein
MEDCFFKTLIWKNNFGVKKILLSKQHHIVFSTTSFKRKGYKKRMPATFDEHEKNEFLHNSLTKTYTLLFIAIYVPQIKKVVIN